MKQKSLLKLESLQLLRYRYRLNGKDKYITDYAVGYNSDDVVDKIYEDHKERANEEMQMEIVDSVGIDWIMSQLNKGDVDLRTIKIKKKNFIYNLRYASDRFIKDNKDRVKLDKILDRII